MVVFAWSIGNDARDGLWSLHLSPRMLMMVFGRCIYCQGCSWWSLVGPSARMLMVVFGWSIGKDAHDDLWSLHLSPRMLMVVFGWSISKDAHDDLWLDHQQGCS